MPASTRATLALGNLGVRFTLHTYAYDPRAERIGLQAADALGVEARRVLKTLMAEVDGKPVCVIIPSDREVGMKKLAAAFHGKTARMMPAAVAERLTGYHVGGISPFGQSKRLAGSASSSTADSAACRSSLRWMSSTRSRSRSWCERESVRRVSLLSSPPRANRRKGAAVRRRPRHSTIGAL
jgi:Cys-tRNA(Pro)/Cys-tRNA(Cys) deacylase